MQQTTPRYPPRVECVKRAPRGKVGILAQEEQERQKPPWEQPYVSPAMRLLEALTQRRNPKPKRDR